MRSWMIIDTASGQLIRSQTWENQFAAEVTAGQTALLVPVGSATISGTFSSTGAGAARQFSSTFNITLSGTFVGSVQLERSFDNGVTWSVATLSDGTPVAWTTPASTWWTEIEAGVVFRLNCTVRTSGTISWMLSQ